MMSNPTQPSQQQQSALFHTSMASSSGSVNRSFPALSDSEDEDFGENVGRSAGTGHGRHTTATDTGDDYSDDFDSEEELDDEKRSPTPYTLASQSGEQSPIPIAGQSPIAAAALKLPKIHDSYTLDLARQPAGTMTTSPKKKKSMQAGVPVARKQVAGGGGGGRKKAAPVSDMNGRRKPPTQRAPNWQTAGKAASFGRSTSPLSLSSRTGPVTNAALRVTSAKRNREAALKNQLKQTLDQLEGLKRENKILQEENRRGDKALQRYEGQEDGLASILRRNEQERQTLRQQLRNAKQTTSMLDQNLQARQAELQQTQRKCKKLEQLVQARDLKERTQLTAELQAANEQRDLQDVKMERLEKQLELEVKSRKRQLVKARSEHQKLESSLAHSEASEQHVKTLLREREKELEVKNIYSQRITKNMPRNLPPLASLTLAVPTQDASTSTDDLPIANGAPASTTAAVLPESLGASTTATPRLQPTLSPDKAPSLNVSPRQQATSALSTAAPADAFGTSASQVSLAAMASSSQLSHVPSQTVLPTLDGSTAAMATAGAQESGRQPNVEPLAAQWAPAAAPMQQMLGTRRGTDATLAASSSTPSLHVNEPPVKFKPTKMTTGMAAAAPTGLNAPSQFAPGGAADDVARVLAAASQPSPEAERAAEMQRQAELREHDERQRRVLEAQREAEERKMKLLAALAGAPASSSQSQLGGGAATAEQQSKQMPAEDRFQRRLGSREDVLAPLGRADTMDDVTKHRVKQEMRRMVMQSDTELETEKTPSNNISTTTLAGSEQSVGHDVRGGGGHYSPPSWPRPVENLHAGRPASYGSGEGSDRRQFWKTDRRIDSASSLLVQQGESEADEEILRRRPPKSLQARGRRATGLQHIPGDSSEVTTTTTTTSSSTEMYRGGHHDPSSQLPEARRGLPRRQTTHRMPVVADTTDDEAYNPRLARRPPRGLASKSNSQVDMGGLADRGGFAGGGTRHQQHHSTIAAPKFHKPTPLATSQRHGHNSRYDGRQERFGGDGVAARSTGRIDVDELPTEAPPEPAARSLPRRTFQYADEDDDDDDDDIEEITL